MAKTDFKSVAEYITSKPKAVQPALRRIRSALRKALPGTKEVISYQIPAYKLDGGAVVYFAGWKQHCSLYPATGGVAQKFKEDLEPYELSKGTIRFPLSAPLPLELISRIAKFRAQEVAARAKLKPKSAKKR